MTPPDPRLKLRPALLSPVVVAICAVATLALMLQFGVLVELTNAPLGIFR